VSKKKPYSGLAIIYCSCLGFARIVSSITVQEKKLEKDVANLAGDFISIQRLQRQGI
jgi:hypothetical protein